MMRLATSKPANIETASQMHVRLNRAAWAVRGGLGPRPRAWVRASVDVAAAGFVGSWRGAGSSHQVAITFDDGPDPEVTPKLLDLLTSYGVHCTFFLLVQQCRKYPDLLREIAGSGHEVGLHGIDHARVTELSFTNAVAYLTEARRELSESLERPIELFRPPFGAQSLASYKATRRSGMESVVWSADAEDWVDRDERSVAADALDRLRPGGILLLHERLEPDPPRSWPTTTFDRLAVVERVLEGCLDQGLMPGTVSANAATGGVRRSVWFRP